MPHPQENNLTPFAFTTLFGLDEAARPAATLLLKASFRLRPEQDGPLIPLGEQLPFYLEGEYWGSPEDTCYRLEPEIAPIKLTTDVVLIATARAPEAGLTWFDAGLRVGPVAQGARVFGERVWYRSGTGKAISAPQVVEAVPLNWHHAFGGGDVTAQRGDNIPCEQRNPFGQGYHHSAGKFVDDSPLPQIENPRQLIRHYLETPEPIGFGFVHPHCQPRAAFAGTYDKAWEQQRKPLLPADFKPRFYQAAPSALQAPHFLQGNEVVSVLNASRWPRLRFQLPGLASPEIIVEERRQPPVQQQLPLDTVIINTDEEWVSLLYRCRIPLQQGAHGVASIHVSIPGLERERLVAAS